MSLGIEGVRAVNNGKDVSIFEKGQRTAFVSQVTQLAGKQQGKLRFNLEHRFAQLGVGEMLVYTSSFEDQNIFIPTYFTLTPNKHDELPDFAFWRKSSSAFKKFKEKKDRKERRNHPENENADPQPMQNHRKCFKLLKK